ncbi:LacI family transcriptional repressor, partial [Lacticaseibacillus paracasei subsp. paracasei Lpp123]
METEKTMTTITDIAKAAGVSIATVSRILNYDTTLAVT